jgi:DNA-binding NtrC family response regulator
MQTPPSVARVAQTGDESESMSLNDALDEYERSLITRALGAASGNIAEAARRLQTDRPNLYRRMRRLGMGGANDN